MALLEITCCLFEILQDACQVLEGYVARGQLQLAEIPQSIGYNLTKATGELRGAEVSLLHSIHDASRLGIIVNEERRSSA